MRTAVSLFAPIVRGQPGFQILRASRAASPAHSNAFCFPQVPFGDTKLMNTARRVSHFVPDFSGANSDMVFIGFSVTGIRLTNPTQLVSRDDAGRPPCSTN